MKKIKLVICGLLILNIFAVGFALQGSVNAQGRFDPFSRDTSTTDDSTTKTPTTSETPTEADTATTPDSTTTTETPTPATDDSTTRTDSDTPSGEASSSSATDDVCDGIKATGGSCDTAPGDKTVKDIIALAINILSFLVGVAAVIMIIINGFKFVTSNGETAAVSSAKNGIIFALIGLVIVALSQVIVRFVIYRATGL